MRRLASRLAAIAVFGLTPPILAQERSVAIDIRIIGFSVDDATRQQLEAAAAAGGGQYYSAENQAELTSAISAATGIAAAGATVSDEVEPNQPVSRANPIDPNGTVSGTLHDTGDHDHFRFAADRSGTLTVTAEVVPDGVDIAFRLLDGNFAVAHNWTTPIIAAGSAAVLEVPRAGTYTLEVADGGSNAASPAPYRLGFAWAGAADGNEPNNRFSEAIDLALGSPIETSIFPEDDVDHYRVTVDHHGALTLTADPVPDTIDARFFVFTLDGGTLMNWTGPSEAGQPTEVVVDLARPGAYVISLADGGGNAADVRPIGVTASFTPSPDPFEPNNRISEAAAIELGEAYTLTILPEDDHDFLRIDVEHPGELTVSATSVPANIMVAMRLLHRDYDVLRGWTRPSADGQDTLMVVDLPYAGPYFLELADSGDNARSVEPFTLTATHVPTPEAAGSNGSFAEAWSIPLDGETVLTILPEDDHDMLAVEAPREGLLTITATDVPAALDIALQVLDANNTRLYSWVRPASPGQDTLLRAELPVAGRYVIEVADSGDNGRSVQPFRLITTFTSGSGPVEPDGLDAPTMLTLGEPATGTIMPEDDHDFYEVAIGSPGTVTVSVGSPPSLDMAFRVFNSDGGTLIGWTRAGGAGQVALGTLDVEAAGTLIIEVADNGDNAASTDPYNVTVSGP
ncbi:MAG: hypothetical protein RLO50_17520 [Azospirillaceae bacterium]